ncbi:MAG TPA: hypothetical protein PL037_04735, partial [Elusimicrobiales bacterium]|nr:hypothetical protein [Elusimicrobiales bacterium]
DMALADAGSAILDGISTWDQVRRTETGTAYYSGDGTYQDSWGGTGDMHLAFEVDFGGRTYGGGSSQLSMTNLEQYTDILQSSFESLTGPATITLVSPVNSTNPNFNNTTISFVNQGGVAAQSVDVNLLWSDPQLGGSAVGQMSAVQSEPPPQGQQLIAN